MRGDLIDVVRADLARRKMECESAADLDFFPVCVSFTLTVSALYRLYITVLILSAGRPSLCFFLSPTFHTLSLFHGQTSRASPESNPASPGPRSPPGWDFSGHRLN